jgi:hypothetical protein
VKTNGGATRVHTTPDFRTVSITVTKFATITLRPNSNWGEVQEEKKKKKDFADHGWTKVI